MPEARDPRAGNAFVSENRPPEGQTKELQVFEGVGAVKKKEKTGFVKWFQEMFWSGRTLKSVLLSILNEELAPKGKDMLIDGLVSILYGYLYRDSKPGQYTPSSQSGNFITRYIQYDKVGNNKGAPTKNAATQAALQANQEKDQEIIRAGYELPSFPDYKSAKAFLESMKAEVNRYGQLSVYDMAWKCRKKLAYTWNEYGWEKEEILGIKEPTRFRQPIDVDDGRGNRIKHTHYIDLPPSHPLSYD